MNRITGWWSRIGLQLKLKILIQGFIVIVLFAAQHGLSSQFETRALKAAKERTVLLADGAINGLNTLMVTKSNGDSVISDPEARGLFIQKMGLSENVKELRIIRGKAVSNDFDVGLPQEQAVDEMDRSVLANGKKIFSMTNSGKGEGTLRAVLPFIAMKDFRTTNCLKCHGVDEGTVLGAASIVIDIKDDLKEIQTFNNWMWAGQGALQIVLFLVIGFIVRRSLNQLGAEPHAAASVAQDVAHGDLSKTILLKPGDTQSLMAQLRKMQIGLLQVVGNVRQGAESVAAASRKIAQGNNDLSARTEQQASSLEETAASMEELGSQVKINADSARQANQLAADASEVAVQGGREVAQVVQTMNGINESSRKIADIISIIDGIAFQTNILALNAAVEAARAGEQGRGFAVVAGEVRLLAGRSAKASKEIKALIDTSVNRVEQGTVLVEKARHTMQKVVDSIRSVTEIMSTISLASDEQSIGVTQVGDAIMQMDQVTQDNAALVEEMAAATESLQSEAQDLVRAVSLFKLSADDDQHNATFGGQENTYPSPALSMR